MSVTNTEQDSPTKQMMEIVLSMGKMARESKLQRGASFSEIRALDQQIATCEKELAGLKT